MTTLLGISGSLRVHSFNTVLVAEAARLFAPDRFILADLDLPLFNGDTEDAHGIPDAIEKLAEQIQSADAVVISTPEYNSGLSGVLKNALDWISRTDLSPWNDKPVAIVSAASGRAGGARAQTMLRSCMTPFRPHILQGPEVMVAAAGDQFDENGHLTGALYIKQLTQLMDSLRAEIR